MNNLLAEINLTTLFTVVGIVAAIAIIFAVLIVLVSRLTAIETDEKTEKVKDLLAGANCGGCGYAGCADFAKALAEGKAELSACGPTAKDNKAKIAEVLGKNFAAGEGTFAVVKCAGGFDCADKFIYVGNAGCTAKISFGGGNKACAYGCLGDGTCAKACDYGAVTVINGVAKVDKDKCVSCGKCVKACPKNIVALIPKSAVYYVA